MESLRQPPQTADRLAIQSQAGAYEVRLRNESFHPVVGLVHLPISEYSPLALAVLKRIASSNALVLLKSRLSCSF
jgi:hypothetical protein